VGAPSGAQAQAQLKPADVECVCVRLHANLLPYISHHSITGLRVRLVSAGLGIGEIHACIKFKETSWFYSRGRNDDPLVCRNLERARMIIKRHGTRRCVCAAGFPLVQHLLRQAGQGEQLQGHPSARCEGSKGRRRLPIPAPLSECISQWLTLPKHRKGFGHACSPSSWFSGLAMQSWSAGIETEGRQMCPWSRLPSCFLTNSLVFFGRRAPVTTPTFSETLNSWRGIGLVFLNMNAHPVKQKIVQNPGLAKAFVIFGDDTGISKKLWKANVCGPFLGDGK